MKGSVWAYMESAAEVSCVPELVCPCPRAVGRDVLFSPGAPGGPWQQISCDEAPSCVTAAQPRILVWSSRVIAQHMELLVTVKQAVL